MDSDIAKLVIGAGLFIGLAFWLVALYLYRQMAGVELVQKFQSRVPDKSPAETIKGLLAAGQDMLTVGRGFNGMLPRVTRPSEYELAVEHFGMEIRFEAARVGGGTALTATVNDTNYTRKFQLGLGAFVLILMPLVIGGVVVALWNFVAMSDSSALRWQSIQVLQIVHVLWPPFLIYGLWKRGRTQVANSVANLLVFAEAGEPMARGVRG